MGVCLDFRKSAHGPVAEITLCFVFFRRQRLSRLARTFDEQMSGKAEKKNGTQKLSAAS
jgi:hypothetical protein